MKILFQVKRTALDGPRRLSLRTWIQRRSEIPTGFGQLRRLATISAVHPSWMPQSWIGNIVAQWNLKRIPFHRGLKNSIPIKNKRVTCFVCHMKLNVGDRALHVRGKKHIKRLQRIAMAYAIEVPELPEDVILGVIPPTELHDVIVRGRIRAESRLFREARRIDAGNSLGERENSSLRASQNLEVLRSSDSSGPRAAELAATLWTHVRRFLGIDQSSSQDKAKDSNENYEILNVQDGAKASIVQPKPMESGSHSDRDPRFGLSSTSAAFEDSKSGIWDQYSRLPQSEKEDEDSSSRVHPHNSQLQRLFQFRESSDSGTLDPPGTLENTDMASPFVTFSEKALLDSEEKDSVPFHGALGRAEDGTDYYLNTYEPFACICVGVQGAGKSHTMAAIAESCMIQGTHLNRLGESMASLVLHYDLSSTNFCGMASMTQPATPSSKAAVEKVVVLVSPYNYRERVKFYAGLPNVVVAPVHFRWESLTAPQIRTLMRVDPTEHMPLYMSCLLEVLRVYQRDGKIPSFDRFMQDITKAINPSNTQTGPLTQRLFLLGELVGKNASSASKCIDAAAAMDCLGEKGTMVIADLTDPMLTPDEANHIFAVLVEKFVQVPVSHGKLLCVDEAHKFLSKASSSGVIGSLDRTLVDAVRQMRHYGLRIAISSQSPLVFPNEMLELASFAVLHHFHSGSWVEYLRKFIPLDESDVKDVLSLNQGEALISSSKPVSVANRPREGTEICIGPRTELTGDRLDSKDETTKSTHSNCIRLKIRRRLTRDVGRSVVAAVANN